MATNTTDVELVRFQASGLETITELTRRFSQDLQAAQQRADLFHASLQTGFRKTAEAINEANRRAEKMGAAFRNMQFRDGMQSGGIQKQAAAMTQLNRQYEAMAAKVRNQVQAQDIATGRYARHRDVMTGLNRQAEVTTRRADADARARDLQSGAYLKHARSVSALEREEAKLARQEKAANEIARYGKAGAMLRAGAPLAAGVATAGLATATGLAAAGFSGTVEMRQFELALQRLSRSMASIAIPALEKLTRAADWGAQKIDRLSDSQKDKLLYAGLATGGVLAAAKVAASYGPALMDLGTLAFSSAGAAYGNRGGTGAGGVPHATAVRPPGGGARGAAGSVAGAGASAGPVGAAAALVVGQGIASGSELAGNSPWWRKALQGVSPGANNLLGMLDPWTGWGGAKGTDAKPGASRTVTPLPGSPTELGGQHFAIQQSVLEATTPLGVTGEQTKKTDEAMFSLTDAVKKLTDEMMKQAQADGGYRAAAPKKAGG